MIDHSTNPYATGQYSVPDAGSYHTIALMDDGGVLCERCVRDPSNPVYSVHDVNVDDHGDGHDGWCVIGWFHTGDTDEFTMCDHCYTVLVENLDEDDEDEDDPS